MEVTQSAAVASTLGQLKSVERSTGRVSGELATGRKAPGADAVSFAIAKSLLDRSSDLGLAKDAVHEGLNVLRAADAGLDAIGKTLDMARAIADRYERTTDPEVRADLEAQFSAYARQVDALAEDASYNGVNLIAPQPDSREVRLNGDGSNVLLLQGQASGSTGLNLTLSTESVEAALRQVRATRADLGGRASALEERADFTDRLVNTLKGGAEDLVRSDLNEDAAQATALDTRRQLSTTSLAIATQSERQVLRLF